MRHNKILSAAIVLCMVVFFFTMGVGFHARTAYHHCYI